MFQYKNETCKIWINIKTGDRIIPLAITLGLQLLTTVWFCSGLLSVFQALKPHKDGVFQKQDAWGPDLCMIGFGKILNRKPTIIEYSFIAKLFQSKMRVIMGHNEGVSDSRWSKTKITIKFVTEIQNCKNSVIGRPFRSIEIY